MRLVLNDVGKALQEQITDEISEYKQVTEDQKKELLDIVQNKIKDIEIQENVSVTNLNDVLRTSVDSFKTLVQESVEEITNQVREGKEELIKEKECAIKEIRECKYSSYYCLK